MKFFKTKYKFKYKTMIDLPICKIIELDNILNTASDVEAELFALSLMLEIPIDDVYAMKAEDARTLIDKMHNNIANRKDIRSHSFLKPRTLTLNNRRYNVDYNINSMTMAQYVDFQLYVANSASTNKFDLLVNILSIFLIPDGHNYGENYNMQQVKDDITTMPYGLAQEISFFLRKRLARLIKSKLSSLYTILMTTKILTHNQQIKEDITTTMKELNQYKQILV